MDPMPARRLRLARAAAMAGLVGLSLGCPKVKIPVPPELAQASEEVPVTGRSKFAGLPGVETSFQIGPYQITDVDREYQISGAAAQAWVHRFAYQHVQGGYTYRFRGSRDERGANCILAADEGSFSPDGSFLVGGSGGTLRCACDGRPRAAELMVRLTYTRAGKGGRGEWILAYGGQERGQLQTGQRDFALQILSTVEGRGYVAGQGWSDTAAVPFGEPTGCLVEGEGPVGGLELLHPGRAWFARSLEVTEREDMACLFGGLLLFEVPEEGPS
jgi:hypothetical protein